MAIDTSALVDSFLKFQGEFTSESELREDIRASVRDLEQRAREILTVLQKVHQNDGVKHVRELCEQARAAFVDVEKLFQSLAGKIPANEYYKFHDHYRFVSQRLAFLAALVVYLEDGRMITRDETAKMLGIESDRTKGFHLDLEDYLSGLLMLASELSRFAVNCVTFKEFQRPAHIAQFLSELDGGFRLLNLKNDALRKKFDGLKYDVKKVEEVLYDLSIRGLKPTGT